MNHEIYSVQSGDLKLASSGTISIVLGSCVSVIIYDPVQRIGGANHFLLPTRASAGHGNHLTSLYFGDESIVSLLREFKNRGSDPSKLIIKIAGGSKNLGAENVKVAEMVLAKFGLRVQGRSVGGVQGRKIEMDAASGDIKMQFLNQSLEDKKKVLIVDDSKPIRMLLRNIFSNDNRFEVAGEAVNPVEAEKLRIQLKPDLITLDLQMPVQDGVSYLKQLHKPLPVPVIVVTDFSLAQGGPVMEALEAGAFHYFQKPSPAEMNDMGEKLRETAIIAIQASKSKMFVHTNKNNEHKYQHLKSPKLIAIGSSTGGTEVVKELFEKIPSNSPPILVVQHMPEAFTKAFADRLNQLSHLQVKEAQQGDELKRGHAYIAPGGKQMSVIENGDKMFIRITDDPPVNRFKPSVDFLFNSILKTKEVSKTLAFILTGMGADGSQSLLELKRAGAFTVGQSEETCLVYGMPRAAFEKGACEVMLSPYEMAQMLNKVLSNTEAKSA